MQIFWYIILTTISVSLISLIGILFFSLKDKTLDKIIHIMLGLSTGALMAGAFLHILPEANELAKDSQINIFTWTLISFIIFFIIEKGLHWRHCHKQDCNVHTFGTMSLIGDAIHNFIDGLIIAGSFVVDVRLGITTTIAVALHEIPQEIGDFGILLYSGYTKTKAIVLNLAIGLTAVAGGIFGYFLTSKIDIAQLYLLPIAAGGFIYIAASDLLPELRKEKSLAKSLTAFLFFLLGITIIYIFSKME